MKKHLFWIVELIVWILILTAISSTFIILKNTYKSKLNTYQIFLPDVDGLIKGSPVKLMGVQVGYVNQIDIVENSVYVKFVITKPGLKIPYGSVATVEFLGLGGSKSLELYAPEKAQKIINEKYIIAQPPKRIGDSLGLLNDMFKQFAEITYAISNFMNNVGIIKSENKKFPTLKNGENFIERANIWIDGTSDLLNNKIFKKNKKERRVNDGYVSETN